jgi:hypothetical protein
MITETQFTDIYNTNLDIRKKLQKIIDETIKEVDFSKTKSYKYDFDGKKYGVFFNIFDKWTWCWINTINTNYSCIYLIIDYFNSTTNKKIKLLDFRSTNVNDTLFRIEEFIKNERQIIFTPGSEVFKKMFFTSQFIWTRGIITVLSSVFTIKKNYDIDKINLSFERGDDLDMTKGIDFFINFNNNLLKTQHKSSSLVIDGDLFISNRFIYNELTYRNNLDLLSIESENKIYLFSNSKDKNLCGSHNGKFFIHKNLKLSEMEKVNQELTELLTELNLTCFQKRIMFMFEQGDTGHNYFDNQDVNGKPIIRFYLNDIHDLNLNKLIKDEIEKLK